MQMLNIPTQTPAIMQTDMLLIPVMLVRCAVGPFRPGQERAVECNSEDSPKMRRAPGNGLRRGAIDLAHGA